MNKERSTIYALLWLQESTQWLQFCLHLGQKAELESTEAEMSNHVVLHLFLHSSLNRQPLGAGFLMADRCQGIWATTGSAFSSTQGYIVLQFYKQKQTPVYPQVEIRKSLLSEHLLFDWRLFNHPGSIPESVLVFSIWFQLVSRSAAVLWESSVSSLQGVPWSFHGQDLLM